jgi:superfamily II DNA helicase RecQ
MRRIITDHTEFVLLVLEDLNKRCNPDIVVFAEDMSYNSGPMISHDLFEELRVLRKQIADDRRVPAYVVFSDATLREMAQTRPSSPSEFLALSGVGAKKLESYGEIFLSAISESLN